LQTVEEVSVNTTMPIAHLYPTGGSTTFREALRSLI